MGFDIIYKFFNSLILLYENTEYGDGIKNFQKYAIEKIKEQKSQFTYTGEER